MGAELNGRTSKGRKDANGSIDAASDRRSRRRHRKAKSSFSGWLFSVTARPAIWYCIITSLFFCPSSLSNIDADSPAICKPYLQARSYVAPYVDPSYETYVTPYLNQAAPYVEQFNTKIYTPAAAVSRSYYNAYAAPTINKGYSYLDDEWERSVQPHLHDAQKQAWAWYNKQVAPYAKAATDNVSPYYQSTSKSVQDAYSQQFIPAYTAARPYAQQAWDQGHHLTVNVIFPYIRWAGRETGVFLSRQLWPQLRVLYGENVEPQLVRISERLGRYKDGKKLEAAVNAVKPPSGPSGTVDPSAASSVMASISETPYPSMSTDAQASASSAPPTEAEVREKIASDLKTWQEKFAKAADKGREDLEERVKEIIDRQIDHQANGVGKALVVQLEEIVNSKLKSLKKEINAAVTKLPEDASEKDVSAAHEGIVKDIRAAGMSIREKAQALRSWKLKYDNETQSLVKAASDSTLEVIDNIRDLGLQEIGMRWAWMEGVTYKDWSKYHTLKKTFDEWRDAVESVAVKNEGIALAKKEGDALEEKGMSIAEDAAKELARLKDVAKWKLNAHDATGDFSSRKLPAAAMKAAHHVIDKVKLPSSSSSEEVSSETPSMMASLSALLSSQRARASRKAEEYSSQMAESAASSPSSSAEKASSSARSSLEKASSKASSSASSASSSVASSLKDASSSAKSVLSDASNAIIDSEPILGKGAASKVSEAILGSQDASDSLSSRASSNAKSASSSADSILSAPKFKSDQIPIDVKGTPAPVEEASESLSGDDAQWKPAEPAEKASLSLSAAASDASEKLVSSASSATSSAKKVMGGVSAGFVAAAEAPILEDVINDDDLSVSEKLKGFVDIAGNEMSRLSSIMAEALKPTPTQGTVESITSVASEQWSSAMSAAMSALYGPAEGTAAMANRYSKAVTAASHAIYGTPPPLTASLASEASARFAMATSAAAEQYEIAKSRLSEHVSGTPKPVHEDILSSLESAYSGSLAHASKKLNDALKLTDSVKSAVYPTQGPLESITSTASVMLASGLAEANKQYSSAMIALGLQQPHSQYEFRYYAHKKYQQAIGAAHQQYSVFVSHASSAAYGTPTPAYESFMSSARERYAAATSAAGGFIEDMYSSVKALGEAEPTSAGIIDAAISQYDSALSAASANLAVASSSASVAFYGSSTGFAESAASAVSGSAESLASIVSSGVLGRETPWAESVAHQASANWEGLVSRVSQQVYMTTVWHEPIRSSATEYAAQATDAMKSQYSSMSALLSELVVGREPDFTESVMSRLSGAYATGFGIPDMASSASSVASEAFASASSVAGEAYTSASSVISTVFTPPATLENVFEAASEQFNAALSAASEQVYGTEKGAYEKATSAASEAAGSAASHASEAVYGTQPSYAEQAQSQLDSAASAAYDAISVAFYGTPAGSAAAVTSAADEKYSSMLSVASASLAAAGSQASVAYEDMVSSVSSAAYGPEKGAFESATSRLAVAVESARAKIVDMGRAGSNYAAESIEQVSQKVEEMASSVSSAASSAASKVRDEL